MSEKEKNKKKKKEKIGAGIVGSTILIAGAIAGGVASIPKAESKGEEEKEEKNKKPDPSNKNNRNAGNSPPAQSPNPGGQKPLHSPLPPTKVNLRTVTTITPPFGMVAEKFFAVTKAELVKVLDAQVQAAVFDVATGAVKTTDYTYDVTRENGVAFNTINLTTVGVKVKVTITAVGKSTWVTGNTTPIEITLPRAKTDLITITTLTDLRGSKFTWKADSTKRLSELKNVILSKTNQFKNKIHNDSLFSINVFMGTTSLKDIQFEYQRQGDFLILIFVPQFQKELNWVGSTRQIGIRLF